MNSHKIWCRSALTSEGWRDGVVIEISPGGEISDVGQGKAVDSDTRLNGMVIPGMPNLHSHGFQRLMAGQTGARDQSGDSFWSWREAMYRLAGTISARQIEDCMAWVFAEMLKAGYTSCAEFHYLHHQADGRPYEEIAETSLRVINAANASGLALTLLPVYYHVSGFGQDSVSQGQRRFRNDPDEFLFLYESCNKALKGHADHKLGIALHSLRAVPASHLDHLLSALDKDQPIHIHVAEQIAEVEECLSFLGARPVEWLLDNAPVNANWCLIHATHMTVAERQAAAQTGAVAGLCPSTEADLGDGFFETHHWLNAGGGIGIGTDSNLRISVSEELRHMEFSERLRRQQRNVLQDDQRSCGRFLFEHAASGGGQALGQATGAIRTGLRADFLELNEGHPQLEGRSGDTILDSFVFAGGKEMIRSVWCAGKKVVEDGHHLHEDLLKSSYLKTVKALTSR